MQAIFLENGRLRYLTDYQKPNPKSGEVLIRVSLAGICSTDLEIVKGYVPGFKGVLGHEFVGVIEGVTDSNDSWLIDRRVVGTINLGCQSCAACLGDGPEHCPQRSVMGIHDKDGVFADYVTLPAANLLAVPDAVADEAAVFTEPLAAALRIQEQVKAPLSAKMAVVGPGRLGLLVGLVMAHVGADVIMLGRRDSSLELPIRLGLETGLVKDFADDSFDFVVETTGNEAGFARSLRLIRPLGTLILKSTFAGKANLDLTKLVVAEINVVGSRCGPFAPALRLLQRGDIDPRPLIDGDYKLSDGLTAFTHAAKSGVRKILLRP